MTFTPLQFGGTQVYEGDYNSRYLSINVDQYRPGEVRWEEIGNKKITSCVPLGVSPDLAQVELEMKKWRGKEPSPGLVVNWLLRARHALVEIFSRRNPSMPEDVRQKYLAAVKGGELDGCYWKETSGDHHLLFATNYHNPTLPDYIKRFNRIA